MKPATRWLLAGLCAAGLAAQATPARAQPTHPTAPSRAQPARRPTAEDSREGITHASQLGAAFSDVAARVLPSVVSLFVEITERGGEGLLPIPGFWGVIPDQPRVRRGAGSGVIVRPDGVILTNHHVVENAQRIRVRLSDGRSFPARVLGGDPATDLAVVKIEATGLTPARLGDSDAARVGEWVLAVGAPFGLEATVTHGVLSATGRAVGAHAIEDYLQTDASINPGNSGGPLVNLQGEVLGINTMVVGRGQGIGFAVPARIASLVTDQIVRHGRVTRGWIGVGTQDITPDLERAFRATATSGALVNELSPGGPAARAGLALGDIVCELEGRPIRNDHELLRELSRHGVGERLSLAVLRSGRRVQLQVTTELRPGDDPGSAPPTTPPAPEPGPTGFGLAIDAVPPALAQRLGLSQGQGVVILEVYRGGAADRAGLRPGDVILRADGTEVRGPDDVIAAARDGETVLLVRRGQARAFLGLSIDREAARTREGDRGASAGNAGSR